MTRGSGATPDVDLTALEQVPVDLDELTRQALAAIPATAVGGDRSISRDHVADPRYSPSSTLPTFYMPGAMSGPRKRWFVAVAVVLIALYLLATVLGVCLTDGFPVWG